MSTLSSAVVVLFLGLSAQPPARVAVGDKVPDFAVTDLKGQKETLGRLRADAETGKPRPVVLMFWCSFCHSCRHVEKDLDKLAQAYKGRAAVVALDASAGETAETVSEFLKEKGLAVPVILDPAGRAADLFGAEKTTTAVVIDAKGVLRYHGKYADKEHAYAEDALKAVLAGKEVAVKTTPPKG